MSGIGITILKKLKRYGINITIEKVLNNVGMSLSRKELTKRLLLLYGKEVYPLAKTAGSIGGGISQSFLKYDKYTDTYTRIK